MLPINKLKLCLKHLLRVGHLPIMACFTGEGKHIHSSTVQSMYDQLSSKLQELGSEKLIADNLSNVNNCTYVISRESENVTAAKLTFVGLSGQHVSGTIIRIKDSNNVWKIDNLQNI